MTNHKRKTTHNNILSWLELRVETTPQNCPVVEETLFAIGALSVTTLDAKDSPIYEPDPNQPPIWPDPILVGLFASDIDEKATLAQLLQYTDLLDSQCRWEILEDRVWETEWMEHFKPLCFGDNFWVYSKKVTEPLAKEGATTLLLDPGLAFGTGTHPTTALCLQWIVENDCKGKTILDYGCGTGLLGIAALLRGASSASFIDIDPQAIMATRQNLKRNHFNPDDFEACLPENHNSDSVDILVANILMGPLVELSEALAKLVKPGGLICLSGILHSQEQQIIQSYKDWFNNLKVQQSGDWLRITGRKP